jgi:hypothetical protein
MSTPARAAHAERAGYSAWAKHGPHHRSFLYSR